MSGRAFGPRSLGECSSRLRDCLGLLKTAFLTSRWLLSRLTLTHTHKCARARADRLPRRCKVFSANPLEQTQSSSSVAPIRVVRTTLTILVATAKRHPKKKPPNRSQPRSDLVQKISCRSPIQAVDRSFFPSLYVLSVTIPHFCKTFSCRQYKNTIQDETQLIRFSFAAEKSVLRFEKKKFFLTF